MTNKQHKRGLLKEVVKFIQFTELKSSHKHTHRQTHTKPQEDTYAITGNRIQAHSGIATNTSTGANTHIHRRNYKHGGTDTDKIQGFFGFVIVLYSHL